MTNLARAMTQPDQPSAIFAALQQIVQQTVGAKFISLTEIDMERGVERRILSSNPAVYPAGEEAAVVYDAWAEQVAIRHETFVANDAEDLRAAFPDHAVIVAMGCASCLNIPIVIAGTIVGTLNLLDVEGHFTSARIAAAEALKPQAALALLVAKHHRNGSQS